ncbi:MAG: YhfC family intramembrane metalloprotease [Clostridiaceae bacterium]|jgi:uncharacterized membrane protein YhfC|nr:YhfC family intramembrane metalloprotease [Clostridiaceae bacterium]
MKLKHIKNKLTGSKLKNSRILWFLSGSACFIISQPLLRLPVLQQLQKSTDFILFNTLYPKVTGILIALSAGVFEESFRFLFKRFFMKPDKCVFSQPVIFGLGHGIAEALIILVPAFSMVHISQLGTAFLERFLAIILHVCLTIIVWNGFQRNQKILYLILAVIIHGFVNSMIPLLYPYKNYIIMIESALAFVDILLVIYSYNSRKYYIKGSSIKDEITI